MKSAEFQAEICQHFLKVEARDQDVPLKRYFSLCPDDKATPLTSSPGRTVYSVKLRR
jgi:hypothetical protein